MYFSPSSPSLPIKVRHLSVVCGVSSSFVLVVCTSLPASAYGSSCPCFTTFFSSSSHGWFLSSSSLHQPTMVWMNPWNCSGHLSSLTLACASWHCSFLISLALVSACLFSLSMLVLPCTGWESFPSPSPFPSHPNPLWTTSVPPRPGCPFPSSKGNERKRKPNRIESKGKERKSTRFDSRRRRT